MIWPVLDILAVLMVLTGSLYGVFKGIRPSLFLLITVLAATLAVLGLTVPVESLILSFSGVNAAAYGGAPAVAVLLLEGKNTAAYLAALIPSFLSLFPFLVLVIGGVLLRGFFPQPAQTAFYRILGLITAATAAGAMFLLAASQLMRLPWAPALNLLHRSILVSWLQMTANGLLAVLAGGGV